MHKGPAMQGPLSLSHSPAKHSLLFFYPKKKINKTFFFRIKKKGIRESFAGE